MNRRAYLKYASAATGILHTDQFGRTIDDFMSSHVDVREISEEEVPAAETSSGESGFVTFREGDLEANVLLGHEWVGYFTLKSAIWGREIAHQYRPFEFEGRGGYWMFPPTPGGRAPNTAVALTSPGDGDLFFWHPPESEITPLDEVDDPRESSLFRTIMHEYIHLDSHTIRGEVDGGYGYPPGWLEHGFTEYTTKEHLDSYYSRVFELVEDDALPDVQTIVGVDEYAVGLFIMKYLIKEYGLDTVNDIYWDPSGDGWTDTEPAVENVLGISIDEFNDDWQAAVKEWFEPLDEPPEPDEGRILEPDKWLVREPDQHDIDIGSPPDISQCPDELPTVQTGGIINQDGRVDTEGLMAAIEYWQSGERVYGDDC